MGIFSLTLKKFLKYLIKTAWDVLFKPHAPQNSQSQKIMEYCFRASLHLRNPYSIIVFVIAQTFRRGEFHPKPLFIDISKNFLKASVKYPMRYIFQSLHEFGESGANQTSQVIKLRYLHRRNVATNNLYSTLGRTSFSYSTVTDFARFLGLSTSRPFASDV